MLQEIIARSLGLELGTYKHAVGSLHLYERDINTARKVIAEKLRRVIPMPAMPPGDPWPAIRKVLKAEQAIRSGRQLDPVTLQLDPYWTDLIRLLQVFACYKRRKIADIRKLKSLVVHAVYEEYIDRKLRALSHST
jgi:thymidylate synthase